MTGASPPGSAAEARHDSRPPRPSPFPWLAIIVLAGGAFLAGAWRQELWSNREARVAVCAREMLASGDWVEPRMGADARLNKPPLAYWLAAAAGAPGGGVTALAAKLPSVLAALGACLLLFRLGQSALSSRRAGFFAAMLLAADGLFWDEAHTASSDMLLVFFVTLGVFGFWRMFEEGRRGQLDRMLPWLAMGLGFLAKGPLAPALVLLVAGGYLLFRRRWRELPELFPSPLGLLGFLAAVLPWCLTMLFRHPEVLDVWFRETAMRFTRKTRSHYQPNPFHYLLEAKLEDGRLRLGFGAMGDVLMPWLVLLPALAAAWWRRRKEPLPRGLALALSWVLLGLVMFSSARSKRHYYLLPLLPGAMLAFGWLLDEFLEGRLTRREALAVRVPLGLTGLLLALLPLGAALAPGLAGGKLPPELVFDPVALLGLALAGLVIVGMSLSADVRRWPLPQAVLAAGAGLLAWAGLAVYPAFNARKSPRDFCARAAALAAPGERVATGDPLLLHCLGAGADFKLTKPLDIVEAKPPGTTGLAIIKSSMLPGARAMGLAPELLLVKPEQHLMLIRWKKPGAGAAAPGPNPDSP